MVATVRSPESETSPSDKPRLALDLNLPVFTVPQKEHWPSKAPWAEAVRAMAPFRDYYMRHFDSPEQRLRDKNPARFRLP